MQSTPSGYCDYIITPQTPHFPTVPIHSHPTLRHTDILSWILLSPTLPWHAVPLAPMANELGPLCLWLICKGLRPALLILMHSIYNTLVKQHSWWPLVLKWMGTLMSFCECNVCDPPLNPTLHPSWHFFTVCYTTL